ncbi:uncharacterized protein LOC122659402 [Telopea speciosissima]|uniref:uncharacterized protein LOC122659402 n=1 Tax=Telopea speciosissima TaxID=54955 RepID=UPI001CC7CB38|nr:uncharacterized protein LOC122659402 [Telopea speciosissima]
MFMNFLKLAPSFPDKVDAIIQWVTLVWQIWKARNQFIFRHTNLSLYDTIQGFYWCVQEGRLGISGEKSKPLDPPVPLNIVLPATNTCRYKIYTDGAWNSVSCLGGRGVMVRNYKGKFVAAKCKHGCSNSAMAMKAEAIRDALLLARSIKLDCISIFSDCKTIIAHLNNAHFS